MHDGLIVLQLLEGRDQAGRVAGHRDTRHIGQGFTTPTDGELHQLCHDRQEDQQHETDESKDRRPAAVLAVSIVPAAATPPNGAKAPVGDQGDDANERDRQRRYQDVVVLDVTQLVGQDAFELDAVHLGQQPGRHCDRRVLRVAAGGKGIGRGVVDDVQARLGEARRDAQALDEVVQPGVLGGVGRHRVAHGQARWRRTSSRRRTIATPAKISADHPPMPRPSRSQRRRPTPASDDEHEKPAMRRRERPLVGARPGRTSR